MSQPTGDFIDGNPDIMMAYAAEGPNPVLLGAQQPLVSRLGPEGQALVNADQAATEELLAFVVDANTLITALTQSARASGAIYLEAEMAAQAAISGVADVDPPN